MSLANKILKLDRRILFAVMFITAIFFAANPIGFPVVTQPWVSDFHEKIAELEPGDLVIVHWSIHSTSTEQIAGATPIMKHLYSKEGIKMIHFSLGVQIELVDGIIDEANPAEYGKEYGKDWIQLGYLAGGETAVAAIGSDLKTVKQNDWYGTPLEELELWKNITGDMNEVDLILSVSSFDPGVNVVRRQLQVPYNLPLVMVGGAGGLTAAMQFYDTKQYEGMLLGMTDNSAYEILINEPGIAARSTDVLSMLYIVAIAFIVLGNVAAFIHKPEGGLLG